MILQSAEDISIHIKGRDKNITAISFADIKRSSLLISSRVDGCQHKMNLDCSNYTNAAISAAVQFMCGGVIEIGKLSVKNWISAIKLADFLQISNLRQVLLSHAPADSTSINLVLEKIFMSPDYDSEYAGVVIDSYLRLANRFRADYNETACFVQKMDLCQLRADQYGKFRTVWLGRGSPQCALFMIDISYCRLNHLDITPFAIDIKFNKMSSDQLWACLRAVEAPGKNLILHHMLQCLHKTKRLAESAAQRKKKQSTKK